MLDHRSILPIVVRMSVMSSIGISSLKIPTILESNDDNVSKYYDVSFRLFYFSIITMISKGLRRLFIRDTVFAALQLLPETPHKKRCRRQESSCPHLLVSFVRDCLVIVKLSNFSHSALTNFMTDRSIMFCASLSFCVHFLEQAFFHSQFGLHEVLCYFRG